jgi:uncharacterized protein (TIGR00255 family)
MAISMTGFGSETLNNESWTLSWEIKSVNNRYLDIKWRVPPALYFLQGKWEKIIRAAAARGRLDIALNLRIHDPDILDISFDRTMAQAMLSQLEQFAQEMGHDFTPDLNLFLRNPSLWQEGKAGAISGLEDDLETSLIKALESWNQARKKEGGILLEDISQRVGRLEALTEELTRLVKDNARERFNELRQRLAKFMDEMSLEADENRLLQELAIMADRLDVSEEITRLRAHLRSMNKVLSSQGEMGRKLDFILQEAFREINTCANKCQNTDMSSVAVDFKAELEKCREQAQNLE